MPRPPAPFDLGRLSERFWSLVEIRDDWECWDWLGYTNPRSGYGQFTLSPAERQHFDMARVVTAPVMSCTLVTGPRPDGLVVCHRCDVPVCCNPYHLSWGTTATNNRDAWTRGRQAKGELHHQARLSDAEVGDVLTRARAGERVADLAAEYDVDWSQVYTWLRGEGRGA